MRRGDAGDCDGACCWDGRRTGAKWAGADQEGGRLYFRGGRIVGREEVVYEDWGGADGAAEGIE